MSKRLKFKKIDPLQKLKIPEELKKTGWMSYEEVLAWKKFEAEAMGRMFPALAKFQHDINESKKKENGKDT